MGYSWRYSVISVVHKNPNQSTVIRQDNYFEQVSLDAFSKNFIYFVLCKRNKSGMYLAVT